MSDAKTIISPAIAVRDLTFSYNAKQSDIVIDIPQWHVKNAEKVFLYGPSGSGKSTLLNLICGTLDASTGHILIDNSDLTQMSSREKDRFRAKHIGVIFQQFNLIPYLSVQDNIALAQYFNTDPNQPLRPFLEQAFETLHLPMSILSSPASELSVGQQQRVAIARALLNKPDIIIADEPTSSLDETSQTRFMSMLFNSIEEQNSTLIFVSHDHRLAERFDRVVSLSDINKVKGNIDAF
ncbi:ABC transporter ATP-binding protein [Aestuariibacter sp. AA17]|uniref:ABC transporter ATP-binding protein n=1 Tax=Fluctibacter corallii TaxID=2984329 RepID=A0ABT3A795_9ALTE|nr:ABC transporter ATP-binding protein [Aestuariibacter sp. AA17]MCV2884556.1 ABC transporter ATP-binding protein [Aestuariibacter sp. AA17]